MTLGMNVGRTDQIARGVIGAGLVVVAALGAFDGAWKVLGMVVGSIAVFTASAAFCPLYRLLDLRSSRQ
jgi:hypothetical protein